MKALPFLKIVTIVNLLVATGFSVAGLLSPGSILPTGISPEKAITIFALYAAARTIPLAAITIISIARKRGSVLITLALLAGIIQLLDGLVGIYQHDVSKSAGPFGIAIVEFVAIYFVMKNSNPAGA
jgi:hypothetical protein